MSQDGLSAVSASRSLMSFVQQLDAYDPDESLYEDQDQTQGIEAENVLKYLRCVRGFLISARARIIESQAPTFKAHLATLSGPIQRLSDAIFLLEREGKRTPKEFQSQLTEIIQDLMQWHQPITALASELAAVR